MKIEALMSYPGAADAQIPFDESLLKHMVPIRELQPDGRRHIANKSHVVEMQPGEALSDSDEHRWLLYLVKGQLALIDKDRHSVKVSAEDVRARHPLFSEKSHRTRAVAETLCKVVRFDRQLFSTLLDHEIISGEQLETIEIDEVEGNIFNAIMHAFNHGQLKLPSLPEIAIKVKSAASNPNASIQDVVRIVEADPAVVARLIQVANSPISRGVVPVKSIRDAIVRLGLATTRNLVVSLSVKSLFRTNNRMLNNRMHELYDHSVEVAAISYAVAQRAGKLEPDQLLLAGLTHDIGIIPILTYIDETGLDVQDTEELELIIGKLRCVVGSMVIKHWGFSSELLNVVEHAHNWQRDVPGDLDLCDVVIIAQIYYMLKHHRVKDLPSIDQVPAFRKLFPQETDPEFVMQVMEEAHEEIHQMMQILKM